MLILYKFRVRWTERRWNIYECVELRSEVINLKDMNLKEKEVIDD
jgi:hypothetical protein